MIRHRTAPLFLTLALLALAAPTARASGVDLALSPHLQYVGAGSGFDVELRVQTAGPAFNAFEAVLQYDPAVLTFVPTSPTSLQQGAAMTAACSSRFHVFQAAGDSLAMTSALLCNGVSITGPGTIYKLHFTAANTPGAQTTIHIRSAVFDSSGVRVLPVSALDDTIFIDNPVGVAPAPGTAAIELRAAPNPSAAGTTLLVHSPVAGAQSLLVQDVAGRIVRHLESGEFAAGARAVAWDRRDDAGRSVAPGVYLARFVTPAGMRQARVVFLR
jgi:hypothetical protein